MSRPSDPAHLAAQALAQQNNDAEAVYRAYLRKRPLRGKSHRKRAAEAQEDRAWAAAEREARPVRAIGFFLHK